MAKSKTKKIFVLDTSVILYNHDAINSFQEYFKNQLHSVFKIYQCEHHLAVIKGHLDINSNYDKFYKNLIGEATKVECSSI